MNRPLLAAALTMTFASYCAADPIPPDPPYRGSWYEERLSECIRPHLIFRVPEGTSDQMFAQFKVPLFANGTQAGPPVLVTSSGLPGFDDSARKAIRQCNPFPLLAEGKVPPELHVRMYAVWPRPSEQTFHAVCHSMAQSFQTIRNREGPSVAANYLRTALTEKGLSLDGLDQVVARTELTDRPPPGRLKDDLCSLRTQ